MNINDLMTKYNIKPSDLQHNLQVTNVVFDNLLQMKHKIKHKLARRLAKIFGLPLETFV